MTGHDDPYHAAAVAWLTHGNHEHRRAFEAITAVEDARDIVADWATRPQLRAAVDAVSQPLLDQNQALTDRITQLEAQVGINLSCDAVIEDAAQFLLGCQMPRGHIGPHKHGGRTWTGP